jgi:hypothetical protein
LRSNAAIDDNMMQRRVDADCADAEEDPQLSANDIARCRAEIRNQPMRKLVNFAAFEIAEKALTENIVTLERLTAPDVEQ